MNKYRARKAVVDGITFASGAEARRYGQLKLLEKAGEIRDLQMQPVYSLEVNGVKVARYIGDFLYLDRLTGKPVLEDVKSAPTAKRADYRMKKQLVKALYGIDIREVVNP